MDPQPQGFALTPRGIKTIHYQFRKNWNGLSLHYESSETLMSISSQENFFYGRHHSFSLLCLQTPELIVLKLIKELLHEYPNDKVLKFQMVVMRFNSQPSVISVVRVPSCHDNINLKQYFRTFASSFPFRKRNWHSGVAATGGAFAPCFHFHIYDYL